MIKYSFILLIFLASTSWSQTAQKTLLTNGFLHVGNGQTIPTALVGIEGEKIILVKNALAYSIKNSDWDTIIDLKGKNIYPGFVAPNSTLGLTEIDAIRATRDFEEVGEMNPHVRSLIAFNVESNVVATVRTNGVLLEQATPRGGIITGTSSVMHLGGWNWEDAVVKIDDGIHLNWPNSQEPDREVGKSAVKKSTKYEDEKRKIYQFFELAKSYKSEGTKELRLEAMKGIFSGEKRIYIHANDVQQLLDVIDFTNQFQLQHPVIIGGYDAPLILDRLKDAKIPIMLPRVHSLPAREEDALNYAYKLPGILQAAGILFCLQNEGDMEAMNARNLPFLAGTAQAYGLSEEQAVRSISLSTCEILGIAKQYGSIEEGKKATLFVSVGNALDVLTNQVTHIFMDGESISIENHQTRLFEKYKQKYNK
jgi:imidazolonepropionase-like amidohydrolase